jgi:hypothetical protein
MESMGNSLSIGEESVILIEETRGHRPRLMNESMIAQLRLAFDFLN